MSRLCVRITTPAIPEEIHEVTSGLEGHGVRVPDDGQKNQVQRDSQQLPLRMGQVAGGDVKSRKRRVDLCAVKQADIDRPTRRVSDQPTQTRVVVDVKTPHRENYAHLWKGVYLSQHFRYGVERFGSDARGRVADRVQLVDDQQAFALPGGGCQDGHR